MRPKRALYSVMETGDILSEGSFKASLESQFISDGDRGVNLIGRIDSWFNQDANLRAVVGSGTTDFYAGGFSNGFLIQIRRASQQSVSPRALSMQDTTDLIPQTKMKTSMKYLSAFTLSSVRR
ncbi:MAG: hypothetical protein IPL83_11100 [Bdellovibrionales bacterium]|nr:hypothetical protein [Bdellovibrionales bacterium]